MTSKSDKINPMESMRHRPLFSSLGLFALWVLLGPLAGCAPAVGAQLSKSGAIDPPPPTSLTVHVTGWALQFKDDQGNLTSQQAFVFFPTTLGGPDPVDTNPGDVQQFGSGLTFTLESYCIGLQCSWNPLYGPDSGPSFAVPFDGDVKLTDVGGFVSGLPFQITGATNTINPTSRTDMMGEFNWLNTSLP